MLSNGLLKILIPVPLIAMMMGVTFYIQFSKYNIGQKAYGGQEMTLTEYARYSYDIMIAKQKARKAEGNFKVADALPVAPEGWQQLPYTAEHGILIMQRPYKPTTVAPDTEHSLQAKFLNAAKRKTKRTAVSYIREGQIVSLYMKLREKPSPNTLEAQVAKQLTQFNGVAAAANPDATYVEVAGVALRQLKQISRHYFKNTETPVAYRHLKAKLEGQFDIVVLTNADDAAIQEVLASLNVDMLRTHAKLRQENALPAPPKPDALTGEELAALATKENLSPEEQAKLAKVEQALENEVVQKTLMMRLRNVFSTQAKEEEVKKPLRAKCVTKQGFKRCTFPKEEE